jgi:cytochrome P450
MLHDKTIYPEPFEFNPDRFMKDGKLNPDVKDPGHATFGFGRRCDSHGCEFNPF